MDTGHWTMVDQWYGFYLTLLLLEGINKYQSVIDIVLQIICRIHIFSILFSYFFSLQYIYL